MILVTICYDTDDENNNDKIMISIIILNILMIPLTLLSFLVVQNNRNSLTY